MLPDDLVFSENAPPTSGSRLLKRLLAEGRPVRLFDLPDQKVSVGKADDYRFTSITSTGSTTTTVREPAVPLPELPLADGDVCEEIEGVDYPARAIRTPRERDEIGMPNTV